MYLQKLMLKTKNWMKLLSKERLRFLKNDRIGFSRHAIQDRMFPYNISEEEIIEIIFKGEIEHKKCEKPNHIVYIGKTGKREIGVSVKFLETHIFVKTIYIKTRRKEK